MTFQWGPEQVARSPQIILEAFARKRDVPYLDLMPAFDAEARRRGKRPADFFLDWNHLNREGSALVAEALASEIEALTQSTR